MGPPLATATVANKQSVHRSASTKHQQGALQNCLALIGAFRAVRRLMPLQHAYAFVVVALDEGRNVSEYANRAGTTQSVMTRILFALGAHSRGRQSGYGLVQQVIDPRDARQTQTFLTVRGKSLVHELVRLIRSDEQPPRQRKRKIAESTQRDLERDQWLYRLIDAGRKLDTDDIQIVLHQIEALVRHRQSKTLHRRRRAPPS